MAEKLVSVDECKRILELSIDDVRYYIQEDVIWSVIHYLDEYRRLESVTVMARLSRSNGEVRIVTDNKLEEIIDLLAKYGGFNREYLRDKLLTFANDGRSKPKEAENKTCPFCGSDSIEVYTHYGESAGIQYGGYYPECTVCGCRLDYYETREEALKAWNGMKGIVMAENKNICFLCEFTEAISRIGNEWAPTYCNHPNDEYIKIYRKTHNVKSAERFVGWTNRYSKELTIKTRPRWCPKKVEEV